MKRLACILLLAPALASAAEDAWRLRAILKSALQLSRPDPGLAGPGAGLEPSNFWRLRLEPEAAPASWLRLGAAYEQRLRQDPPAGSASPAMGFPFRLESVESGLGSGPGLLWRHELDRAWIALEAPRTELVLGRQALGLGRGMVFSVMDIIAPFSPLEADREWRRGVDGARLDLDLGAGTSLEALCALDKDSARSAWIARVRSDFGFMDAELLGGAWAQDLVYGAAFSAPILDAEFHAEAMAHYIPDHWTGPTPWGTPHLIPKIMIGASYSFALGAATALLAAEFMDNRFGAASALDLPMRLADPDFATRLSRGLLPLTAQQAVAVSANLEFEEGQSASLLWLMDPYDNSAIVSPGAFWDLAENLDLQARLYTAYGRGIENGIARSHYGAAPLSFFLQLRVHR